MVIVWVTMKEGKVRKEKLTIETFNVIIIIQFPCYFMTRNQPETADLRENDVKLTTGGTRVDSAMHVDLRQATEAVLKGNHQRQLHCSDRGTTGYKIINDNPGNPRGPFRLELEGKDKIHSVFTNRDAGAATKIIQAFEGLEDTHEIADLLRMLIEDCPASVLVWALDCGRGSLADLASKMPKKFDWSPYENYQRTFDCNEGGSVTVTTELDKSRYVVTFKLQRSGKDGTIYPISTVNSGMILAALEDESKREGLGKTLVEAMEGHEPLVDVLNIDMLGCYATTPPTLKYKSK